MQYGVLVVNCCIAVLAKIRADCDVSQLGRWISTPNTCI